MAAENIPIHNNRTLNSHLMTRRQRAARQIK